MASSRPCRLRIKGWTFHGEWAGGQDKRPEPLVLPAALQPSRRDGGEQVDQVEPAQPVERGDQDDQGGLW